MGKVLQINDRVVDPSTGARGTIYAFQEPNHPWHSGGCPLVKVDASYANLGLGHAWHAAVHESEAKTCSVCGGVMWTPTCNHDGHVEARLVERIAEWMVSRDAGLSEALRATFHPKNQR